MVDRIFRIAECPVCGGQGELMNIEEMLLPCGMCREEDYKNAVKRTDKS